MDGKEDHIQKVYDIKIRETIVAQQKIGFPMVLRGFLVRGWLETMDEEGVSSPDTKTNAFVGTNLDRDH